MKVKEKFSILGLTYWEKSRGTSHCNTGTGMHRNWKIKTKQNRKTKNWEPKEQ